MEEKVLEELITNNKVIKAVNNREKTAFARTKLMVIGNGGAGKTSTIRKLLGKPFQEKYLSTEVGEADAQVQLSNVSMNNWEGLENTEGEHILNEDCHYIHEFYRVC